MISKKKNIKECDTVSQPDPYSIAAQPGSIPTGRGSVRVGAPRRGSARPGGTRESLDSMGRLGSTVAFYYAPEGLARLVLPFLPGRPGPSFII